MSTRLNNLGSILGSFIVLMIFGMALAHDFAFVGYKLHPFLLAIAAAAIAYGLIEALFAFVVAVAIYLAGLAYGHGTGVPSADPHMYILFSFVTCAVVLGLVQNSRVRQLIQARSELEEVRSESERLRQRLQVVNTANQKLNDRILGEVTTVQSFADVARRLSVLEEKDLYPALCDLVGDFAHAQESSIYMLQGDHLVLKAQRGWESVPQEARSLVRDRDLLWSALEQRKVLTPLDLDKNAVSGQDTGRRHQRLICAPIFHPQSGEAMGVLSVDRLPFAHLHGNTLGMLGVIAKWAGDSLYNASSFHDLSKQLLNDEFIQGCVPPILLEDRFNQDLRRGQAGTLIVCQLQGLKTLDGTDQIWFRKTLNAILQPLLRPGVSVGRSGEESYVLMFPRPNEAQEASPQLVSQLRDKFAQHPQSGRLSVFVGSATSQGSQPYEATRQQAMKSAQRC